jgi:hypothetical protein
LTRDQEERQFMVQGEQGKKICVQHKFANHRLNPAAETIILGTFNPGHDANKARFFYSSPRNQLWSLLPRAFGEQDLRAPNLVKSSSSYRADALTLLI